jgi:hypothetical protein
MHSETIIKYFITSPEASAFAIPLEPHTISDGPVPLKNQLVLVEPVHEPTLRPRDLAALEELDWKARLAKDRLKQKAEEDKRKAEMDAAMADATPEEAEEGSEYGSGEIKLMPHRRKGSEYGSGEIKLKTLPYAF